ncbi:MAG: helix-hairpin-helix domain-containing protein [Maricaulaceae bacterium]|jgi:DNA polymerase (family 10)
MTVSNSEIADMLDEIGDLLAYEDANPFRVRAYHNAARTVRRYGDAMSDLVAQGADLAALPAIGEDLAGLIKEIVRTGRARRLTQLKRNAPSVVLDLLAVPGIGPSKARALWRALHVRTLEQLHRAALDGRVRTVPGFGAKSEARLLEALADLGVGAGGRISIARAAPDADALTELLRKAPGAEAVEVAGSFRRGRETVGDLDVVVAAKADASVVERLTSWRRVKRVEMRGDTRATVILTDGLQVDLRVVRPESYGAALQYMTGSKAHSIQLRIRARDRGLKLNEYGLWRGRDRVAGKTEEEVYKALDLPLIPPELRENRGEIEVAEAGKLPKLVRRRDLKGDLHVRASDIGTVRAFAEAAAREGLKYLAIAPHVGGRAGAHDLTADKVARFLDGIDKLARADLGVALLKAVEVDVDEDGALDLPTLPKGRLDFVIGSVQEGFALSRAAQTKRLVAALESGRINILSHPSGRIIARREPYDVDMKEVARAAAACGCALELSADPERLDLIDAHCQIAKQAGALVSVSSEAARPVDLSRLDLGAVQARRGWLEARDVLNAKPLSEVRKILSGKRAQASRRRTTVAA